MKKLAKKLLYRFADTRLGILIVLIVLFFSEGGYKKKEVDFIS